MNQNQTDLLIPTEFFFSVGRLAAISSLLFILLIVLIVIFLLFYQQHRTMKADEQEDCEQSTNETLSIKSNFPLGYSSMSQDEQSSSMEQLNKESTEEKSQSRSNLIYIP